jgi:hypothetical protein
VHTITKNVTYKSNISEMGNIIEDTVNVGCVVFSAKKSTLELFVENLKIVGHPPQGLTIFWSTHHTVMN